MAAANQWLHGVKGNFPVNKVVADGTVPILQDRIMRLRLFTLD